MGKTQRYKRLTAMCAGVLLAVSFFFGSFTFTVRAGISTNTPSGKGLMAEGTLNSTDFRIADDSEASAYSYLKGNTMFNSPQNNWITANKTFKNSERAADSRLTYKLDIPVEPTDNSGANFYVNHGSLVLRPVAAGFGVPSTPDYAIRFFSHWGHDGIAIDANANAAALKVFAYPGGIETEQAIAAASIYADTADVKYGYGWRSAKEAIDAGQEYYTLWLETDMSGAITVYRGYDAHDGTEPTKIKSLKITDAFEFPADDAKYSFCLSNEAPGNGPVTPTGMLPMDNLSLAETHDVNGTDTETVIKSTDFEDASKIANSETADFLSINNGWITSQNEIVVTNPQENSRVVSLNRLATDLTLDKTFELSIRIKLDNITAGKEIGLAFGLKDYRDKLSDPAEGASFIYLVKHEDKISIGAKNIANGGVATAVGTLTELVGLVEGVDSEYISIEILGKGDGTVSVKINETDPVSYAGLKTNGAIAITQLGDSECTYRIDGDSLKVTGYVFVENDNDEKVVSSSFDGNWLNAVKFHQNSSTSPHIEKTPESKDIMGLTVENGKVGFYGTSTNTRLMFAEGEYSDFVFQFDYIGTPAKQKGKPVSGTSRYSPFYVLFGSKDSPQKDLSENYAIGIVEGNVAQYFWGAESLLTFEGRMTPYKSGVQVLSDMTTAGVAESDTTIPCYTDATNTTVGSWGEPTTPETSFYNKTTRVKLVVVNSVVGMYTATVTDGVVGTYTKQFEITVGDTRGYVGLGSDSPGWAEVDNMAITPITAAKAKELGTGCTTTVDLVADIPLASMAADPEPTPLAKPVVTYVAETKKIIWTAVAGAAGYNILIKQGTETVYENVIPITALEYSVATLAEGEYKVSVSAIATDQEANFDSAPQTITMTIASSTGGGENGGGGTDNPSGGGSQEGCTGCSGSQTAALPIVIGSLVLLMVVGLLVRRKKN